LAKNDLASVFVKKTAVFGSVSVS